MMIMRMNPGLTQADTMEGRACSISITAARNHKKQRPLKLGKAASPRLVMAGQCSAHTGDQQPAQEHTKTALAFTHLIAYNNDAMSVHSRLELRELSFTHRRSKVQTSNFRTKISYRSIIWFEGGNNHS